MFEYEDLETARKNEYRATKVREMARKHLLDAEAGGRPEPFRATCERLFKLASEKVMDAYAERSVIESACFFDEEF